MNNKDKIKLIQKYLKKQPNFLELVLENYEKFNIYISINKIDKNNYRLYWFDLDLISNKNIDSFLSCEYIESYVIDNIREHFINGIYSSKYNEELLKEEDIVHLKINTPTKTGDIVDVTFRKYLPGPISDLMDILIFIFKNMPKRYEEFLFEMLAKITRTTEKYEYKKEFDFDLFKDDINKLFSYQICQRGLKYYEESRIAFLEKIDDRYFAVVEGNEKYLVVIKFNEDEKKMQVYCSCPCEFYCKHMYAVILSIRNKEFNRFYKITYKNPDKSLLDRVMSFDYFLCLGVVEQNLEIINNYGEIELVPILDINNRYNWEVLEDSNDESLTKEIKYFLDNR